MISLDELKHLFDMATGSMDFGSGFYNHEDVVFLRHIAELIGVDVKEGTPSNFRASFAHEVEEPIEREHRRRVKDLTWAPVGTITICGYCRRNIDNPVHHGTSVAEPTSEYEK